MYCQLSLITTLKLVSSDYYCHVFFQKKKTLNSWREQHNFQTQKICSRWQSGTGQLPTGMKGTVGVLSTQFQQPFTY